MAETTQDNVGYYEFLSVIHEISIRSQSIQNDSIRKVYQNYDLRVYSKKLDREIAKLDKLLTK